MPERRAGRVTAGAPVQFDRSSLPADDDGRCRDRAARAAANLGGGPAARRRTRDGYPVTIRNGLPFTPYRLCCTCGRRGHYTEEHPG